MDAEKYYIIYQRDQFFERPIRLQDKYYKQMWNDNNNFLFC